MRVLVIGGSGRVGTGVLPYLAKDHDVLNLDVRPPQVPAGTYVAGSLFDRELLKKLLDGADGMIYMALGPWPEEVDASYDINVRGVHYALQAALDVGLMHVVYTSTGSVHNERTSRAFLDESLPLEAVHVYGFTKGLGERVCEYFSRMHGLSVIALRLFAPTSHEAWLERCRKGMPNSFTTHADTARAYVAALQLKDHKGFDAVFISGDHTGTYVNCAKAKRLLGWEPLDRFTG